MYDSDVHQRKSPFQPDRIYSMGMTVHQRHHEQNILDVFGLKFSFVCMKIDCRH